jgi:hypothetical protein
MEVWPKGTTRGKKLSPVITLRKYAGYDLNAR